MNKRTHFFIKIYVSHFILGRRCFLCVRGELEMGTDCYILTQSSSDHSSTSFASWLGCSTVGHCLELVLTPLASYLQLELTQAVCGTWLYLCLTPTCFRLFTLVHLLIESLAEGQYVTPNPFYKYIKYIISKHILFITFLNKPEFIFLHTVKWFQLISNNSLSHKYTVFCLHTVKSKNSSISNNSIYHKYSLNVNNYILNNSV